jgi:glycine dehydrogenase subunit 2
MKLIFEKSVKGRDGYSLPQDLFDDIKIEECLPEYAIRCYSALHQTF